MPTLGVMPRASGASSQHRPLDPEASTTCRRSLDRPLARAMTLIGSPRRLGEHDRLGTRQVGRRDADELAALPLPDAPLLAAHVGLQIDRPYDGLIGTVVRDRIEQLLAVETDLLDRLLAPLQACLGPLPAPGNARL